MSAHAWLAPYLTTQLLVLAAFPIWLGLRALSLRPNAAIRPSQLLRLTHWIVAGVVTLPWLASLLPTPKLLLFPIREWARDPEGALREPMAAAWQGFATFATFATFAPPPTPVAAPSGTGWLAWLPIAAVGLGAALILARLAGSGLALRRLVREAHLARRIGRVRVLVHDTLAVPCSFWVPGRAYVLLPSAFLDRPELSRLAILHELQHHRQGDTRWVHAHLALKAGLFWNPLVHLWERGIATLQEFACDEALVDQKKVSPRAYGSCLVTAAELSLGQPHAALAGTASMAEGASGQTLRRRIEMMIQSKQTAARPWLPVFLGTVAFAALGAVALAGQGALPDRKLTLEDARALAARAPSGPFPIVINAAVVEQLNRFVATTQGRKYMRDALARMPAYRAMIEAKLEEYDLPMELLAVPIVESGYENRAGRRGHGSGIWMFIASTARNYGLRVDETTGVDDRLDPALETDAAMRLLGADFLRFQDWQLALLGYNAGENAVQRKIDETGSRDAWRLLAEGLGTDRNYLPMVMAAALILRHPSLVQ